MLELGLLIAAVLVVLLAVGYGAYRFTDISSRFGGDEEEDEEAGQGALAAAAAAAADDETSADSSGSGDGS